MTDNPEIAPVDAATVPGSARKLSAGASTYLYVSLFLVAALVVVPLLARLHTKRWFRERAVPLLSGAIVVVGLGWFVERVFF